ncbi:hypothetical protein JCM11251_003150 [Rhodosporidiobolus azoricus]
MEYTSLSTFSATHAPPALSVSPLERLPPHLLHQILHHLPLPTLIFSLKPVSRTLYSHALAVARPWALPLWREEVERALVGGSTDPIGEELPADGRWRASAPSHDLPAYSATDAPTAPPSLPPRTRELAVFDLFLVSLARSSALLSASSLFSASNDSSALSASFSFSGANESSSSSVRSDLFRLLQPRARAEDLVVGLGRDRGLVERERGRGEGAGGAWEKRRVGLGEVAADDIRVELKIRQAALLLPVKNANGRVVWKMVVETPRRVQDGLECVARWLVDGLERVPLRRREDGRGGRWYEGV